MIKETMKNDYLKITPMIENEYSLEQSTDALTVSEYYEYLDNYYDEHPKETFLIMKIIETWICKIDKKSFIRSHKKHSLK